MSIETQPLTELSINDLDSLIIAQVPESIRLEYKRDLYGPNDNSKKELLKDVSALANSQGGHLIIGIAEDNGVAAALYGTDCVNADDEILRMEQVIRSGIEPNITGIRIRAITIEQTSRKSYCFILQIPQSQYPPHRVIANQHNRFYIRNSAGVHEPDIEELKQLFGSANKHNNQHSTGLRIQPLNLYGYIASLAGLLHTSIQTENSLNSPAWSFFALAAGLHSVHALIATVTHQLDLNKKKACAIQICIYIMLYIGLLAVAAGCISILSNSHF